MFQSKTLSGKSDKFIILGLIIILTMLLIVMIFHRDVVVDEGNYLYAGRLVADGRISDMVYYSIQGPVFTLSQGIFHLLFGPNFLIRRIIMTAFGIGGLIFAGFISKKIGGVNTLIIYFMILMTSVYTIAHYNVVTTYSLASFFLYLALFMAIFYNNKIILSFLIILIANFTEQSLLVRKHRIFQKENPIEKINYVSRYVKETVENDKTILTYSTLLASQSGNYIPLNFALGCFSYEPSWTTEKCDKYKTSNSEIFMNYISDKKIKLIALGDFDLHQFGPDKKNILEKMKKEGFIFAKKFENFGQWHDNLYIWVRKNGSDVVEKNQRYN